MIEQGGHSVEQTLLPFRTADIDEVLAFTASFPRDVNLRKGLNFISLNDQWQSNSSPFLQRVDSIVQAWTNEVAEDFRLGIILGYRAFHKTSHLATGSFPKSLIESIVGSEIDNARCGVGPDEHRYLQARRVARIDEEYFRLVHAKPIEDRLVAGQGLTEIYLTVEKLYELRTLEVEFSRT